MGDSKIGPYELNQIYCGECSHLMESLPDNSIPFWLTSPPYDGLRTYKGYTFNFEAIAQQLYRVTQPGGVGVWVVGDETKNGSESGASFRQALYFMGLGFNLHDTMIYERFSPYPSNVRYWQSFEYMFVFSKENLNTFNPLKEPREPESAKRQKAKWGAVLYRRKDGTLERTNDNATKRLNNRDPNSRMKSNIWRYNVGGGNSSSDPEAFAHPGIFPEALARDHILSWSNPGDLCFDPMAGSGTTPKMAYLTGRNFLGFEISQEYTDLARRRLEVTMSQPFMPGLIEEKPKSTLPESEQLGLL